MLSCQMRTQVSVCCYGREKNDEVVKYALSRSVSPAIIADYETRLIPKEILRKKLNELYNLLEGKELV